MDDTAHFGAKIFACALLFLLLVSQNAYAYLDPGTGSYVIQILIAAFVGGLFAIKPFFSRIKSFFKGIFVKGKTDEHPEE